MQYLYEMSLWLKHHCKRRSLLTHWVHRFITVHIRTPLTMNWVPWTLRKNQLHRSWQSKKQEPDFLSCSSCFFTISHTISISMSSAIKWRLVPIYLSRRSTQCKYISRRSYTVQVYVVYILLRSQSSPLQICPAICPCAWRIHGLEVALDGFTIRRIVSVVNGAVLCRYQAQDGSTMFTLSALCLTCLWPALNSGDNVVERHMGEWKWPGGRTKGDKWHIGRIGGNLWWKEKGRQEWPRAAMTVRLSVRLTGDRKAFP